MYYLTSQKCRKKVQRNAHLNSLPMFTKDINAYDGLVEIWICALSNIVIQVLLIAKHIHPFEYEFEQGFQILRTGTRDEDVRVSVGEGSGNGQPQRCGLSSPTGGSERYS